MTIVFSIPGPPKGKQRARYGDRHAYTPEQTVNYEALVKLTAAKAMREAGAKLTTGAVHMHIVADMPMPESWSQRKRNAMLHKPAIRTPDWDNIGKIISDALNWVMYRDDRQVYYASVERYWAEKAGVTVSVHTEEVHA